MQIPGPTILAISFAPLVFLFLNSRHGENTKQLILLAALCSIPPYLAAGPVVAPFKSDRNAYYFPLAAILPRKTSTQLTRGYYELWETGWKQETEKPLISV